MDSARSEGRELPLADGLKVRFWGVRGSISCSGAEYARYGGNTSCLEVTAGGRRLIFDAGTGIRPLGLELARQAPIDIDIYFTHTHLDHISGLTFFAPLFEQAQFGAPVGGPPRGALHAEEGREQPDAGAALSGDARGLPGAGRVQGVQERASRCACGEMAMRTAPLNHPNGATGYRVEFGGKSICYITDTEHRGGGPTRPSSSCAAAPT